MEKKVEEETREFIEVFRMRCGKPIEMQTAFDISVLNVLWSMIAGSRFSLEDERLKKLGDFIHTSFRMLDATGGILNQMPFLRYVAPNSTGFNDHVHHLRGLYDFLKEVIAEHKTTVCESQACDLIDSFIVKMREQTNNNYNDEQLLSVCLDLLMAGSETTSNTLAFAVLYMAKYPNIQKRVQQEILDVTGDNRWPNFDDRIRMPYTEAVIIEVQRISNIPPLSISHRAMRDTQLQGKNIPKDTIILPSLYSIHMNAGFWKNPEEFMPERFLAADGKISIPEKYFLPFGLGRRRCIGEHLAKVNMFLFLTALLHNFEIDKDPDQPYPEVIARDGVTLSPKVFRVVLRQRVDC